MIGITIIFWILAIGSFLLILRYLWQTDLIERCGNWYYKTSRQQAAVQQRRAKSRETSSPQCRPQKIKPTRPVYRSVWEEIQEREQEAREIEQAQIEHAAQGKRAWVLALAQAVKMHKSKEQIDDVEERAWDVLYLAQAEMEGRLTVDPLYLHYQNDDTIPPKLRAKRFYEALGPALAQEGFAERPSYKQGWRLTQKGVEVFELWG